MDSYCPRTRSTDPEHRYRARMLVLLILAFTLVAIWTIRPHAVRAAVDRMETILGAKTDASGVAPAPARPVAKPHSGA